MIDPDDTDTQPDPNEETRPLLDDDILAEGEPNGEVELETDPEEREESRLPTQDAARETEGAPSPATSDEDFPGGDDEDREGYRGPDRRG